MTDDLYQQAILDRAKSTPHAGRLQAPDASVTVDNPLCGDRVTLDVRLENGRIADVKHQVRGCVLCQASAAVLADAVTGSDVTAARTGRETLGRLLGGAEPAAPFEGLAIFVPVRGHKSRHDCVRLPFDALEQALSQATKK